MKAPTTAPSSTSSIMTPGDADPCWEPLAAGAVGVFVFYRMRRHHQGHGNRGGGGGKREGGEMGRMVDITTQEGRASRLEFSFPNTRRRRSRLKGSTSITGT